MKVNYIQIQKKHELINKLLEMKDPQVIKVEKNNNFIVLVYDFDKCEDENQVAYEIPCNNKDKMEELYLELLSEKYKKIKKGE